MANEWYGQQQAQQRNANNGSLLAVPVQGETGAQNYLVGAGNTVLLTDFNAGFLWIKTNDGLFQTIRTFEVKEITPQPKQNEKFIQRAEFEQFQKNIQSQFQQILDTLVKLGGVTQNESANTDVIEQSKTTATEVQRS